MICSQCKTENRAEAKYCKSCGKGLQATKKCPLCAENILAEAKKCRFCGSMLAQETSVRPKYTVHAETEMSPESAGVIPDDELYVCRACSHKVPKANTACPICGAARADEVSWKIISCRACGKNISSRYSNCPHCGVLIVMEKEEGSRDAENQNEKEKHPLVPRHYFDEPASYYKGCRNCGKSIPSTSSKCPYCGQSQSIYFKSEKPALSCRKCGEAISNTDNKCPHCGVNIPNAKTYGCLVLAGWVMGLYLLIVTLAQCGR